jgi:DNA-binding transcriptional regulator YiaG
MRELRIQHQGRPYPVLYAFDPRRAAVLLIGGDKTGSHRWYEIFVSLADRLYDEHLADLEKETMAKARNFRELEAKMSPESRARVASRVKETLENMSLDQLRAAREHTQEHLVALLGIKQASISKMERRTDMYIGTLARFIEAMGANWKSAPAFRMALCASHSFQKRHRTTQRLERRLSTRSNNGPRPVCPSATYVGIAEPGQCRPRQTERPTSPK